MIACLIILPFVSMAQKQLGQLKVKYKGTVNFKEASLHSTSVESKQLNPLIVQKINQRLALSQAQFTSPLLPSGFTRIKQQVADDGSFTDKTDAASTSPAPLANFKGSKEGADLYPPDPGGAAGPTYLMHTNNQEYNITDKTGAVVVSLTPDDFWAGFAGSVQAIAYPHVEYDAQLQHFYICTLAADLTTNDYSILFGASETSDPTGNWALYSLDLGPQFIQDAPQIGYSKRWFTIATMQFDTAAPYNFNSTGVYLMSVANMASGNLSNVYFVNDSNFFSMSPVETQDPNINDHYLVSNLGSSTDTGYLYVVHVGGSLVAPTYNYDGYVTKALPWNDDPTGVNGAQKGTNEKIFLGNTKLTGAAYRNAQVWTSHTVYLPVNKPKTAAIQWWEFNIKTLKPTQVGRVVNNPGTIKYGYPSIAVNKHNDALLGYNQFSATTFPSAAYSYRNGSDAKNSMRKTKVYKQGKAAYFDGGTDTVTYYWGSYTSTSVDPSDSTFWTVQEYAESPANKWGTWWAHVGHVSFAGLAQAPVQATAQNISSILISPNPANSVATINWTETNSVAVKIQVSNSQGNVLLVKEYSAQKGSNKVSLNISNLISGVYSVTILNGVDVKKAQLVVE